MCSRDCSYLSNYYAQDPRLKGVSERLGDLLKQNPQATLFQVKHGKLAPVQYKGELKPSRTVTGDVVVIGAELASLSTAVEAAERGFHVVVLYAGPLGGLSADTGGNMRYFDVQGTTSHPKGQKLLWRQGLGVEAWVSIPPDTDNRLKTFFGKYADRVDLIQTESYDALWVDRAGNQIQRIVTPEGVAVQGKWFIDSDPEARVAEKAGLTYTVDTPHMSDGLTFDVLHMSQDALDALGQPNRVQPEEIERLTGVSEADVAGDKFASLQLKRLRENIAQDFVISGADHAYGFCGLAMGFQFYMACIAIKHPSPELSWLNSRRYVSGFNVARFQDQGCFNSISYRFYKDFPQHSHSLSQDAVFRPIRQVEIPALQRYLRYVADDASLTVRMPPQFYVRKSTAFFALQHPYTSSEFNIGKQGAFYTRYPMDLRDLYPRDAKSWKVVMRYVKTAKGKHFWNARASAAETAISNLFLVNKCGVTPQFSGGQRIEQSAINLGAALVSSLPK